MHGRAYSDYPESWNITNGIPMNRHYTQIHMPWFERLGIDKPHGARRILCVGAGIGQFVPQWVAWGWQVTCLELDQWAATFLENAYPPVTVVCDDFMRWEPAATVDAIVSTHKLEHFREADRAFERMVSMLAPGGKLYIEVPDQSDLYIPGHLWHFTGQTLRRWANALGLEEVQVDVRYPRSRSSRSGFTGSTFSPGLPVRSRN